MKIAEMKELIIGNVTAKIPIIQGGMGVGISLSGLASAVANQGGIGVISAAGVGMYEPDFTSNFVEANIRALRKEIRLAREKTKGLLGVNIMVAMTSFENLVQASLEEGIDFIFSGAGLPLSLPKYLEKRGRTKLVPIVSSGRCARIIARRWADKYDYTPDAVVVEGPMAGGHLGFSEEQINDSEYALENLVTDVINEMKPFEKASSQKIPVIAGGGIYTGEDIHKFMQLGAAGVQMATRFVTTKECDASDAFKNTYIQARKEDIGIIKSPVGLPGRAIINKFIEDVRNGEKKPYVCPFHCISTCDIKNSPYCISFALMNAKRGKFKNGFAFAGANAYRAEKIETVKEIFDTLKREYADAARACLQCTLQGA